MADDDKKKEGWDLTLGDALKVGLGLAVGVGAVTYLNRDEPKKKASANVQGDEDAPRRRKKAKRRAAPKTGGSAATSEYSQFVKARMPSYIERGVKSSDAMSKIAAEWKAKKGR